MRLAVIGKDVTKSESPAIHEFILKNFRTECRYEKVSIPPEAFSSQAEALFSRYDGFNVTIPFKGEIVGYLKELRGDAKAFGAVNTVLSASRVGYNTDGYGFMLMLEDEGVDVRGKSVLVLGAGGAGRSCIKKIAENGAVVYAYGRDFARLTAVFEEIGGFTPLSDVPLVDYDMIVNCTGVGMHATEGETPVISLAGEKKPVDGLLSRCGIAVDLIYTPKQSEFLRVAEAFGKKTVNGAAMLFFQAYLADCIFCGRAENSGEAKSLWKKYSEVSQ